MSARALSELEMFELLQAAYPEKFHGDDDGTWDSAMEFADEICGWTEVADLLGRVVMLTMPMKSGVTGDAYHCLGKVEIHDGEALMTAAVRRKAK